MQQEIHPNYHKNTKVVCACGNTFTTGSTKPEIHVEICSNCHPFYTGSAKFIDTEGRVEKFQRQQKEAVKSLEELKTKKESKQKEKEDSTRPQSLREMMELLKKQQ